MLFRSIRTDRLRRAVGLDDLPAHRNLLGLCTRLLVSLFLIVDFVRLFPFVTLIACMRGK